MVNDGVNLFIVDSAPFLWLMWSSRLSFHSLQISLTLRTCQFFMATDFCYLFLGGRTLVRKRSGRRVRSKKIVKIRKY